MARVFGPPFFTHRRSTDEIDAAFVGLRAEARIEPITIPVPGIAAHPEDDLILATALSARAEHLVTGDRRLRERGEYGGVRLLSPREFLAVLDRASAG